MIEAKIIELIRKTTEELLQRILEESQFKVRAKIVDKEREEVIWVNIEIKENPNLLIGQKGSNLAALQHLVRLIVRHKVESLVNFIIDINSYKENRINYLRKLARLSAEKVLKTQEPVVLEAMSPFERRIIHLTLANQEEVVTESAGEEGERRVVIKLREN